MSRRLIAVRIVAVLTAIPIAAGIFFLAASLDRPVPETCVETA